MLLTQRARHFLERLPWPRQMHWRFSRSRLQPFHFTLPNRYPWLFRFAAQVLPPQARILSFGCSTGEELISLSHYLPHARIAGIEIDPRAVEKAKARTAGIASVTVQCAATAGGEDEASFDAVFCLAVLCDGRLTARCCTRSDAFFTFDRFEDAVGDLARCLKPGGFFFLLTANFRFCDTAVSKDFDVVFTARDEDLAQDLLYDRNNRMMPGARYLDVVFRRRCG